MIAAPLPDPPLGDHVVALRGYTEADVQAITVAFQDPELLEWLNVPAPYTRGDALRFLARGPAELGERSLAIHDARDDRLLGGIGVRLEEMQRYVELGYWVAADARGRGVATRAIRLVSRWALGTLGAGRVQILAAPGNVASLAAAERAGFRREGVLRSYRIQRGGRVDLVMLSLLPGELR